MIHDRPEQAKKLLRLLDHMDNDIFIHIDRRSRMNTGTFDSVCRLSKVTFIPSRRIHWGGFSQMWTEIRLLEASVPGHYSRYHLISGRDLPLHSQEYIHDFTDSRPDTEFISMWPPKDDTFMRYHYYTLFPEGNRFFLTHWLNGLCKKTLKALHLSMNNDKPVKYGANWFCITDSCAQMLVRRSAEIRKRFRHVSNSDELMLQTTVYDSCLRDRISGDDLRLVDWSAGGRHPHTFTIGDWDRLDSATELFARKFDEKIDNEIIEKLFSKLYE